MLAPRVPSASTCSRRTETRPWSRCPAAGAASAIAEITHHDIVETLTKAHSDSQVTGPLAESWTTSPNLRTWTIKLRKDARFHNGEPFGGEIIAAMFDKVGIKARSQWTYVRATGPARTQRHRGRLAVRRLVEGCRCRCIAPQAWASGIGPGKVPGLGMLSVAPGRSNEIS
jgi:hypothetical protein